MVMMYRQMYRACCISGIILASIANIARSIFGYVEKQSPQYVTRTSKRTNAMSYRSDVRLLLGINTTGMFSTLLACNIHIDSTLCKLHLQLYTWKL